MEKEIARILKEIFIKIGIDKPINFDNVIDFIKDDIQQTRDYYCEEFTSEDILIGFRRFIELEK